MSTSPNVRTTSQGQSLLSICPLISIIFRRWLQVRQGFVLADEESADHDNWAFNVVRVASGALQSKLTGRRAIITCLYMTLCLRRPERERTMAWCNGNQPTAVCSNVSMISIPNLGPSMGHYQSPLFSIASRSGLSWRRCSGKLTSLHSACLYLSGIPSADRACRSLDIGALHKYVQSTYQAYC